MYCFGWIKGEHLAFLGGTKFNLMPVFVVLISEDYVWKTVFAGDGTIREYKAV